MKINLPFKLCWLTLAMLIAFCTGGYANAHKGRLAKIIKPHSMILPIKGVVKDSTGEVLIGVSVGIKGTTQGTLTDVNGAFTINANPGDVLVFTYIGYNRKEVTLVDGSLLTVMLGSSSNSLHEVVVTALGYSQEVRLHYLTTSKLYQEESLK